MSIISDVAIDKDGKYYDQDGSQLQDVIATFEKLSGLTTSILLSSHYESKPTYRTRMFLQRNGHHNQFCWRVKSSPGAKGCGGYDGVVRAQRARTLRRPFVDECPYGVIELVIPFIVREEVVGTIFCGQLRKYESFDRSFRHVWERCRHRHCRQNDLRRAFDAFRYHTHADLVRMGNLLFHAISHISESLDDEKIEREIKLRNNKIIRDALAITREQLNNLPSEGEISESLGVSREYFSRLFRRVMNKNFIQYITELRVARAQELLTNTTLPIVDVAAEVGYNQQSYFSRKFRELCGVTPREFRASSSLIEPER